VQLVVIPVEETRALPGADPAIAKARLGATHILHASITPAPNGGFHLEAEIVDTSTGLPIREYRSNFTAGALPAALPEALTATVAAAFHLPRACGGRDCLRRGGPGLRHGQLPAAHRQFERAAAAAAF
jgi:hypothetical protein